MAVSVFHIMDTIEKINDLFDKEIIDDETFQNILSYTKRLQDNNIPVIYNLRHVRKIFKIKYKRNLVDRFVNQSVVRAHNKKFKADKPVKPVCGLSNCYDDRRTDLLF